MAPAEQGDTVGLLLDIEQRSVAVYLNGRRLGACTFPLDARPQGDIQGDTQ